MSQENINQPKKSIWRWFRWVLLGIGILIIGIGTILYCFYIVWMRMDAAMIKKAESALAAGIRIDDGENDFVILEPDKEDVGEINPAPYRLAFLDVKSLSLGADEKYLYYKVSFFDKIPQKPTEIDGDHIRVIGSGISLMDQKGVEQAGLTADFGWLPVINMPTLNTYYFTGPTGILWPETARFARQDEDSKITGGGGTDFILGAFPLNKLGLNLGQEVYLSLNMEVGSDKYSHAAVDALLGEGKTPAMIKWKLGTKVYEIVDIGYTKED